MANVNIKFNGKEFLLSCQDGQEDHLEELSINLNNKFDELKNSLGNIGESKLLLITSIKLMDEYYETKKNINSKKKEIEELKSKFKELKNLIYRYKEEKDIQINNLNKNQTNLKNDIEETKINYEALLDSTTSQIEDFLQKVNKENLI
tara:strand:+ start:1512 stop:1955 length:444 start_codon:yes stop_codon:yes gene_type:complete